MSRRPNRRTSVPALLDALLPDLLRHAGSEELRCDLEKAAQDMGYDFAAMVRYGTKVSLIRASEFEPLLVTYPNEWVDLYMKQEYWRVDPTTRVASRTNRPVLWNSISALTTAEESLLKEAQGFGICDGLSVPVHSAGELWSINFARKSSEALSPETVYRAQAVASLMALRWQELQQPPSASFFETQLTERERECLSWVAIGKSSWDIGQILSISADTADFHMKNAMRKLECGSRVSAVVKAIRLGLIRP